MPVPKRRTSRAKRDRRRAHDALSAPAASTCPNCHGTMQPHRACPSCGHYKGREIIAMGDEEPSSS